MNTQQPPQLQHQACTTEAKLCPDGSSVGRSGPRCEFVECPTIKQTISEEEKKQIDNWIEANDLNPYGDRKGTAYSGGSPLFNEMTGQAIDKYEYIYKKHPDRPWR